MRARRRTDRKNDGFEKGKDSKKSEQKQRKMDGKVHLFCCMEKFCEIKEVPLNYTALVWKSASKEISGKTPSRNKLYKFFLTSGWIGNIISVSCLIVRRLIIWAGTRVALSPTANRKQERLITGEAG